MVRWERSDPRTTRAGRSRLSPIRNLEPLFRHRLEHPQQRVVDALLAGLADDLVAGAAATETALSESFPWLSPIACRQLARAASYQWR